MLEEYLERADRYRAGPLMTSAPKKDCQVTYDSSATAEPRYYFGGIELGRVTGD